MERLQTEEKCRNAFSGVEGKSMKSLFEHLQHHGQFLGNSEKKNDIADRKKKAQLITYELLSWGLTENYRSGDR